MEYHEEGTGQVDTQFMIKKESHSVTEILAGILLFFALTVGCKGRPEDSGVFATATGEQTAADLVFSGGGVYTVSKERPWAEAVAVRNGRIVYVGDASGLDELTGPKTKRIALEGKMLLPGFHDSHVHLVDGGIEMGECDLKNLTSLSEIVQAVVAYAAKNPGKKWVKGSGWPLTMTGGTPDKSVLDKAVPDRPVLLASFDGHSAWANSKALALAGITKETADPAGGVIERDPKTKEPTGILREDAASLVSAVVPEYTKKEYDAGLALGLRLANSLGITSAQEAFAVEPNLEALKRSDDKNQLTARVVVAMGVDAGEGITAQVKRFVHWRKIYAGKRLRVTAVKMFQDGVIETQTAALLAPYLNTNGKGLIYFDQEKMSRYARELDNHKFQIHVHAIGDRAIRTTLDALEAAKKQNGTRDARHQIAHIELFDPADIPRFQELGVIANFQPLWAFADQNIEKLTLPFLGPKRSRWLYPIKTVQATGARLACGSDWTVTSMNPLEGIQVAVTRRGLDAGPGPAWIPEEVVDLPTAIACYTSGGAYASFQEDEVGTIEVGKAADFALLDRNLFEVSPDKIGQAKVLATFLDGREVYRK